MHAVAGDGVHDVLVARQELHQQHLQGVGSREGTAAVVGSVVGRMVVGRMVGSVVGVVGVVGVVSVVGVVGVVGVVSSKSEVNPI